MRTRHRSTSPSHHLATSPPRHRVAQERSKGFMEGIKAFPGIKIVATQPAEFDRGKALDVMTNVLQSNRDIVGVYAANDKMALGVIAALKAAGLSGKVKVVGNDGIADAVTAIKDGSMYATNAESPFALGSEVMALAPKLPMASRWRRTRSCRALS